MKTIVWDVDDVLNCLTKEWFENYWLKKNPDCKISYSQINKNPIILIYFYGNSVEKKKNFCDRDIFICLNFLYSKLENRLNIDLAYYYYFFLILYILYFTVIIKITMQLFSLFYKLFNC